LCHQDENDKKYWSNDGAHATIFNAIRRVIAIVPQRVLHDSIPIVASGDPEKRQEGHAKVTKVRMFAEALARHVVIAF